MASVQQAAFIALCAITLYCHRAQAGELVPYNPPVRQAVPPLQSAVQTPVGLPDDIHQRFAREVRTLKADDRNQLTKSFEQQRDVAHREGDAARELHYLRLLDILRRATGGQP